MLLEDRLSRPPTAHLYHAPAAVIVCTEPAGIERAFADIEHGLARGLHAAGFFSYELGYALEPRFWGKMPPGRDMPLIWFGLFEPPLAIDPGLLDDFLAGLGPPAPLENLHHGHDLPTHSEKLQEILRLIRDGDIYQANLTFPISFRTHDSPLRLYAAMRSRQPVSFGGFASIGTKTILSVSPELFLETQGKIATTRPMKGTAPRGTGNDFDLSDQLANDPKQRAENLMIVDLLRNDLSRIAEFGSVCVPKLFEVETYPGFLAMSSTVTAVLRDDVNLREKIAALFPCGSIVGAPKIRAAEILRDLESTPRGVYTGALGRIAPNGDVRFNVAIRTAVLDRDGQGSYGVGGGIVAESQPDEEYAEALLKARVLTGLAKPYDLVETFRWEPAAGFLRLDHHLARLSASAAQLGFAIDSADIEHRLSHLAQTDWRAGQKNLRVRLVLRRDGQTDITATALPPPAPGVLRVCIARARLDPGDPFLRHKTSLRDTYETAFAEAIALGWDEAVFLNTRGEISEASRHTVFARRHGMLLTPPLSSGVLPGVLRHTLLQSGAAREEILRLADLDNTQEKWFVGNSLRGLREAVLAL